MSEREKVYVAQMRAVNLTENKRSVFKGREMEGRRKFIYKPEDVIPLRDPSLPWKGAPPVV